MSRGKALEEAFFFQMDQELIEQLRKRLQREEKLRSFGNVTGIRDEKHLEALVDAGFELSTLTAFIWVPLVFVAWADGNADELERKAILDVLQSKGISEQTATMMVDHPWFRHSPAEKLWQTWEEFAIATLEGLDPTSRAELIDEIINLCYVVARASGGYLGIGKVSQSETDVIDGVIRSLGRRESSEVALN